VMMLTGVYVFVLCIDCVVVTVCMMIAGVRNTLDGGG
jgi:hypothetical protein